MSGTIVKFWWETKIENLEAYTENLKIAFENLRAICPRRVVLPDGSTHIWRCPEDSIPVTNHARPEPKSNLDLESQIAGEQKVMAHVAELVRHFPMGHTGHWDPEGNRGRTCPLCIEQQAALKAILNALQEPACLGPVRPEP